MFSIGLYYRALYQAIVYDAGLCFVIALLTLIQVRHSITRVHNLLWTLVIIIDIIEATFDAACRLAVYIIV